MSQHMSSSEKVNTSQWDKAIADAQELLDRVEQKATRLRSAIRTFKESKAAGEPNVRQSVSQTSESCPSI
jgi:hypothetical protein